MKEGLLWLTALVLGHEVPDRDRRGGAEYEARAYPSAWHRGDARPRDVSCCAVTRALPGARPRQGIMASILFIELVLALQQTTAITPGIAVAPKAVALELFGPYVLAVEIASMLLLAGLVGAYHLGRRFLVRGKASTRTGDRQA